MPNVMRTKKLSILICIFGFLPILLFAQNYSKQTSDLKIIEFIKDNKHLIGGNKLDNAIIPWDSCNFYKDFNECWLGDFIQTKSDTIITDNILELLQKEFDSIDNKTKAFNEFKNKQSKKRFFNISIPIIIESKNIAVVKFSYWCGDECGSGGILIFRFENGKWRKIDNRCTWIS
jgi:hypothetical protein